MDRGDRRAGPRHATEALAHDLSGDGSLIVGEASSRVAFRRAFIWTAATGMQDLGTPLFPNDADHSVSYAFGTSGNGSVIVGRAIPTQTSLIPQSFRFTTAAGFGFLTPTLPNDFQSEADGVSDDGAVVVCRSYDSNTFLARAFRWKAGVIQDLGNVAGPPAYAFAASSDGSTVVGLSGTGGSGSTAFRWTAAGGMHGLGDLGGDFASSSAADVSADGSVVVGSAPMLGLTRAFRWTTARGIEDLNTVLADLGVNTNNYQLVFADAVSADGTVIVGMAENLNTHVDVAYRAVVPPPRCAPVTCAALGKNCGSISNGCGGSLNCGTCTAPQTCGGGGVVNVCGGCRPTTCAAQVKKCGAILDGCGGWIACGTCTAPQVCGGAGTPNVCATPPPIPKTLTFSPNPVVGGNPATGTVTLTGPAPAGGAVVTLSSGFPTLASVPPNVTVAAGATSANYTVTTTVPAQDSAANLSACLNGQCVTSTLFVSKPTTCTPTTCAAQGKNCGTISDGCGGTLNCGACTAPQTCGGGGVANVCGGGGCTPTTCAAQGKNCGSISDGCGGTLSCGTCTAPQTCGGGGVANVCGGGTAKLTLTATGRSGETAFSSPSGLSVPVGSAGSPSFTAGTSLVLQATNDRDVIWSGVCSSGGNKTKTCTFTLTVDSSETANVQ